LAGSPGLILTQQSDGAMLEVLKELTGTLAESPSFFAFFFSLSSSSPALSRAGY
jgi:hypothetical protein